MRQCGYEVAFSIFMLSVDFHRLGGDEGNRTLDPLLAGQVLSQLSYTPDRSFGRSDDLQKLNNERLLTHKSVYLVNG